MKKLKPIPHFQSEKEEREFWQKADSTDYVDYLHLEHWQFPDLKLSSRSITIRLPNNLLDRLKLKAHQADIPYQTYIKKVLFDAMFSQPVAGMS